MQRFRVNFDEIEWEAPLPGVRFKAHRSGERQIRLTECTPEFVEPQWCEKSHYGLVLDGTLEVDFCGDLVRYDEGEGIFIPGGPESRHKIRALTPLLTLILVEDV
ncbi:MAG: hypothetical protein ACYC6T_17270 [Thermoleophilia bacterium]